MDRFIRLLKESKHCVFLSGAGISTLSGIPDFRGNNGIYRKFDADKIFDIDHFHAEPEYFYSHSKDFIYNVDERNPNIIHYVLSRLEQLGLVRSVITQNIDLLHQKAGSRNVIEIHGSPKENTCLSCGKIFSYDHVAKIVREDQIPKCDECGGLVKPNITFFGEMLDQKAIMKAVDESSYADLFVVIGSSLVVHPAATLPFYSIRNKGKLVIVNNMPTPLDEHAVLRYKDLGMFFEYLDSYFRDTK
ncbi:NAD-dependent protein deacylase [Methanolobus sp. ZRKC2]|uniref:NAD-dependent protein deacylase n=1 Tax=Methanolobus sp. ZRKC2 TaxID=3125783 RepID=UPI0032530D45